MTFGGSPFEGVVHGMRVSRGWIPMEDGVRLAVTLYSTADADPRDRFPALLEYLPYRKDDQMFERDVDLYSYVVPRGYVAARVDIRGTGASEGVVPDGEYSDVEWSDGVGVIAWLASQPWCTGGVGMWGISWGGFNAIQMGSFPGGPPPGLKAICALMASDDLFTDDIHLIDGMVHVDEYEVMVDLLNAIAPSPDFPIDEETLASRFDREPWKLRYLREQRDGPFWRRGSLRPSYGRLAVPAMLVGGWLDGYRDSVFRMAERCPGPVEAIAGPWAHDFPHSAGVGPRVEWRSEAVRFFDRWLKGAAVPDGPRMRAFVRTWHPPREDLAEVPGSWTAFDAWPPPEPAMVRFRPSGSGLVAATDALAEEPAHPVPDEPTCGVEAGFWWGELTPDQGPSDARSLVFDSEPLEVDLHVLGIPSVLLTIDAVGDGPIHLFARVCDVAPDGSSALVSGGGRRVSGGPGSSAGPPRGVRGGPGLDPGPPIAVEAPLRATGWSFPAGHRIRLALSTSMWPMIWPAPARVGVRVHPTRSWLELPTLASLPGSPPFEPPTPVRPAPGVTSGGDHFPSNVVVSDDRTTVSWSARQRLDLGWSQQAFLEEMTYRLDPANPADTLVTGTAETTVQVDGRELVWRGDLDIRSDSSAFHYRYARTLTEDGQIVRERAWEEAVPRDHH